MKTNSQPVSPVLRSSPKDLSTLYTALKICQEISIETVGPHHRVIITLDLDLYKLALQIQQSNMNKHWLLQPGHLHKFFADLHALGIIIEGSGLDTIAVESGIYSAAAIRGILGGKQYTRGVEYHIMNALAILSLKMEAVIGHEIPEAIKNMTKSFRNSLHSDNDEMLDIYEDLARYYIDEVRSKMPVSEGLAMFLDKYLSQVETMLTCIAAIHARDLEGCLTAIDRGVNYYRSADLPWYFRLIAVYLGQMSEVKQNEPETWNALKEDFVVTKSTQEFCNLFIDQGLEQEIKRLKRFGALPGLTQEEDLMDRFITTSPPSCSNGRKVSPRLPQV